ADAEQQLSDVADALHERGDSLASEWRHETLAALDRALAETAELATGQQRVAEALRHGETGPATRSQQASVEEGTDAVARQISEAAGKHALVSPQLAAALGYAKRQMAAARAGGQGVGPPARSRTARSTDHRAPAAPVPSAARCRSHAVERRARPDQGPNQPLGHGRQRPPSRRSQGGRDRGRPPPAVSDVG